MIFSWKKITLLVGIIIVSLGLGTITFAQDIPDDLSGDGGGLGFDIGPVAGDVDVDVSPENPGAFTSVNLYLRSDYIDLNRYQANWFVDGKLVQTGIGKRSYTVKTKNYGQPTVVTIDIKLASGAIKKQIVLAPEDMAVLWEAVDSYVPPFYLGKKLPARQATLKVISIPNFSGTNSTISGLKSAVYNWRRNDLPMGEAGGYGKDSLTFQHNKIRGTEKIESVVTDLGNTHRATKSITLSFYDPKILFYEQNPTTKLRSPLAKRSTYLTTQSTIIQAEPYFFSVEKGNPDTLNLSWTINNNPITTGSTNKASLLVQSPEGAGNASIGLTAEQPALIFQEAKNIFNVTFNKK